VRGRFLRVNPSSPPLRGEKPNSSTLISIIPGLLFVPFKGSWVPTSTRTQKRVNPEMCLSLLTTPWSASRMLDRWWIPAWEGVHTCIGGPFSFKGHLITPPGLQRTQAQPGFRVCANKELFWTRGNGVMLQTAGAPALFVTGNFKRS
jgi:hypothetical protein